MAENISSGTYPVSFLLGAPRSGTSALVKMLDMGSNVLFFCEAEPKLRIETRAIYEGISGSADEILRRSKDAHIREVWKQGCIYGDKNPCYLSFVDAAYRLYESKYLLAVRDGRDVVRSMMNWHEHKAHNIYIRPEDGNPDGPKTPEEDPWDYSRLRPLPDNPLHARWPELSRFEKCAWGWAEYNRIAIDKLSKLPQEQWRLVDMTKADTNTIRDIYTFLDLDGFDHHTVSKMLGARINSVPDRTGKQDTFPGWKDWSEVQSRQFWDLAGDQMRALGYNENE